MSRLPVRKWHPTDPVSRAMHKAYPDAFKFRTLRVMIGNGLPFPSPDACEIFGPTAWYGGKISYDVLRMVDRAPTMINKMDTVDPGSLKIHESGSRALANRGVMRHVWTWTERDGRERWSLVMWTVCESPTVTVDASWFG